MSTDQEFILFIVMVVAAWLGTIIALVWCIAAVAMIISGALVDCPVDLFLIPNVECPEAQ